MLSVEAAPTVMLQDYAVETLEVGYETGSDRLLLWLPMTVTHVIDENSPLRNWKDPQSILMDQDATIVAIVSQQGSCWTPQYMPMHCLMGPALLWSSGRLQLTGQCLRGFNGQCLNDQDAAILAIMSLYCPSAARQNFCHSDYLATPPWPCD